jgi:curved DNA-binding protein CbpA
MSGIDASKAEILKKETGLDVEFFTADEKLIKTIGRSNPGIILWKDGKILEKWHYKKLPPFDKVAAKYLK